VARLAVQPVQFKMLLKMRHAEESLQRGLVHLHHVRKAHVIGDQGENLLAVVFRKSQTMADSLRHFDADVHMPIETDAIGSHAKRRRLAHIVQQRAPGQSRGAGLRQLLQQQQRMDKDIALGMKLRRLLHALHGFDLGQNLAQ